MCILKAKWLLTIWASMGLNSTVGENLFFFRFWAWPKDLLNTIVCSFFSVSDHVPLQKSCLIKKLLAVWTLVHLASMIGEHMSLHFALVLLRSGTFITVAFVTKSSFQNLKDFHLVQRLFGLVLFRFRLNCLLGMILLWWYEMRTYNLEVKK